MLMCCLLFMLSTFGGGTETQVYVDEFDGTMWVSMPEEVRTAYVMGFMASTAWSNRIMLNHLCEKAMTERDKSFCHDLWQKSTPAQAMNFSTVTVRQLKEGLTSVYSDPDNLGILLGDTMYLVKARIEGVYPTAKEFEDALKDFRL